MFKSQLRDLPGKRQWMRSGSLRDLGFTLIELMIVVAIIAIIAAIAYPSYINSVVKTKRAAAEGCLSQYANYMERYYTTNLRYDHAAASATTPNPMVGNPVPVAAALDCSSAANSGADYTFSVATPTLSTYTVTAAPQGVQATRDAKCGILSINQLGTRTDATGVVGGSPDCW